MHKTWIKRPIAKVAKRIDQGIAYRGATVNGRTQTEGLRQGAVRVLDKLPDAVLDDGLGAIGGHDDEISCLREIRLVGQVVQEILILKATSKEDDRAMP